MMKNEIGIIRASFNLPLYKCPSPGVIIDNIIENKILRFFIVLILFSVSISLRYNGLATNPPPITAKPNYLQLPMI